MLAAAGIKDAEFSLAMTALGIPVGPLVVAISGGADSTALLLKTTIWAQAQHRGLLAVTVDHGLRVEAADEARHVAKLCASLDVPHDIVKLSLNVEEPGNLQDRARRGRYSALTATAQRIGAEAILVGHTADDQAETVLMRLIRGSGVDGLAGMPATRSLPEGVTLFRPLLTFSRDQSEATCREAGIAWVDDPSNVDDRFTRVRIREVLAAEGLSTERLHVTAVHMSRARQALDRMTDRVWQQLVTVDGPQVAVKRTDFDDLDAEIALRLLARALQHVGGGEYRPRFEKLDSLYSWLLSATSGQRTLAGCLIRIKSAQISVTKAPRRQAKT